MTREEKRAAIKKYCDTTRCDECPLQNVVGLSGCYSWDADPLRDADIERNYAILFPDAGDSLDHPEHYNREGAMECIEEMLLIFGPEETMTFCKLNAWKYRYRAADKGGMDDLQKSDRYLAKYKELKERME